VALEFGIWPVARQLLDRVREITLRLPGVVERVSHGEPCFFVGGKRPLCYFHDNHNGDGRVSLWLPAPPGVQEELATSEPERFFRPTPSARGVFADWIGVYLDVPGANRVDWREISAIVEDAFRHIAPRSLISELDER
jgi:hypothetical protein